MATPSDIRAERIGTLMGQLPVALLVSLINAILAAGLLVFDLGDLRALPWLGAIAMVSGVRLLLWRAWQRRDAAVPARHSANHWGSVLLGGAVAAGLVWGLGAVWLIPTADSYRLFWLFLIGGMCAGAAALHYAHLPTALGFLLAAGLPITFSLALEGGSSNRVEAMLMLVFLAALGFTAQRSSRQFGILLRLQLDLADRTREAAALADRLRAEVAEHQLTEGNLRHAQKMQEVGQLTSGIAHDFNNLLMTVQGSLRWLRNRLPTSDEESFRLLDNANSAAERSAHLTKQLLAFSRHEPPKPELAEPAALVEGMQELLSGVLTAASALQLRFPEELPKVRVDKNQFERALLNLVLNGRDAMPSGGTITISGREAEQPPDTLLLPPGGHVVLAVSDTGEGMDAATLARATERFFTTKGAGKGTGLGLTQVREMAIEAGGALRLQSQKGAGTIAELWLPAVQSIEATVAEPPPAVALQPSYDRRNVLVVDDDPLVLAITVDMLKELGHSVLEATSGPQALALLEAGRPVDLIVTDYAMPLMTGVQLATEARRLRPGLPVLVATGYTELPGVGPIAAANDTGDSSALPSLVKPFGPEDLALAIEARFRPEPGQPAAG